MEGVDGDGFTVEQWESKKEEYFYRCAYCNKKTKLTADHVVPIFTGGIHDINNIVPACKNCNSSKQARSLLIFMYSRL
jgi:5-methylcytosine-specific restriction endonuclease McrA